MSHPQPKLPSAAQLIAKHSVANVLVASQKTFIFGRSRPMNNHDCIVQMIRKYG